MARVIDLARFSALVEEHFGGTFAWGRSDCALAACDVWRGLGLPDAGSGVRGRYQSAGEALLFARVEDKAAEIFARLGWPEIEPAEAEVGDAGLVARWLALRLPDSWVAKAELGAIEYAPERARRAWRVPL